MTARPQRAVARRANRPTHVTTLAPPLPAIPAEPEPGHDPVAERSVLLDEAWTLYDAAAEDAWNAYRAALGELWDAYQTRASAAITAYVTRVDAIRVRG